MANATEELVEFQKNLLGLVGELKKILMEKISSTLDETAKQAYFSNLNAKTIACESALMGFTQLDPSTAQQISNVLDKRIKPYIEANQNLKNEMKITGDMKKGAIKELQDVEEQLSRPRPGKS